MNKKLQILKYVVTDSICAIIAWSIFHFYRKHSIENVAFDHTTYFTSKFFVSAICIVFFWDTLYYSTGSYNNIYRRSRIKEFAQTFFVSVFGVIVLFFVLLLDDNVFSYKAYYQSLYNLFFLHFGLTATSRFIISSITNHQIHNKQIGFNTILIGSNENAWKLFNEIENQKKSAGTKFVGFVHVDNRNGFSHLLSSKLAHLGEWINLKEIIITNKIEEVIVAIESAEHEKLGNIINQLHNVNVVIKIIPSMYDILSGSVKMTTIFGAPLIEISRDILKPWELILKRAFDICISLLVLSIFSPLYLILILLVKMSSEGPAFYKQERIGRNSKPFFIYKFRSMFVNAEKNGPQLSSESDSRITNIGRFLRRTRLDELPQFYNVLKGDMSIVGPRPERQFYIDKIIERAPHYIHLLKVRPGITSWGQVKYGYAENVDEMIDRLKFDVMYIENMSFLLDLKILIYTTITILQGRGK